MLMTKVGKSDGEGTFAGKRGNNKVAPEAVASASAFDGGFRRGSGVYLLLSQLAVKKRMTAAVHKAWADIRA